MNENRDRNTAVLYIERRTILGNLTPSASQKYGLALRTLLKLLEERSATIDTLTEKDSLFIIANLQTLTNHRGELLSEATRQEWYQMWKTFLIYATKTKGSAYNTLIEHKYKINKNRQIKKSTFCDQEINLLLTAEKSICWKLFFETVFCTGPRIGEALRVRNQDVQVYEDGTASIHFPSGKTGPRTVYVVGKTADSIRRWQTLHPYHENPAAPFFLNEKLHAISYKAAEVHFKALIKKSGLFKEKPCLHGIRASAVTNDSQYLSSHTIRKKYGWTASSNMEQVYIRQSGIDLKAAELNALHQRNNYLQHQME